MPPTKEEAQSHGDMSHSKIWADWQNRQVHHAMETDEKQEELEEKTRFAASFKATCVRSTEYCNLADGGPFNKGRPTQAETQKKKKRRSDRGYLVKQKKQNCAKKHVHQPLVLDQQESEF